MPLEPDRHLSLHSIKQLTNTPVSMLHTTSRKLWISIARWVTCRSVHRLASERNVYLSLDRETGNGRGTQISGFCKDASLKFDIGGRQEGQMFKSYEDDVKENKDLKNTWWPSDWSKMHVCTGGLSEDLCIQPAPAICTLSCDRFRTIKQVRPWFSWEPTFADNYCL